MRIGIDARFVGPEGTGLGKYTEKLIENLAILDDNNQYVIFLRRSNWDWLRLKSKNFKKVLADIPWYSLKEQIKLPKIFSNQNLDLLHFTHFNVPVFYRGKFIVTIHDLIHHRFRQESATTRNLYIFKIKRFAYRHVINHAVKDSQKILTPSNFVKDEIVRTFRIDPAKIVVTYEAAEEEYFRTSSKFKVQSSKFLEKYNINQPFIIYIGNAYPHKNLERLLQAFKILVHGSQSEDRESRERREGAGLPDYFRDVELDNVFGSSFFKLGYQDIYLGLIDHGFYSVIVCVVKRGNCRLFHGW